MDAQSRSAALDKLNEMQRLIDEIRGLCPIPNMEASLRFVEMYARWAQFNLTGSDRYDFEVGMPPSAGRGG